MILRKTMETDLEFVLATESGEESRRYVSQQTYEEHLEMLSNPDVLHMIIEKDTRRVGYVIMAGLKKPSRSIELKRIVIAEKGQGFGRKAIKLCKQLAFDKLNAHRLWLDLVEYNTRALNLYLSEGFVQEGVLRECDLFEGRFESMVVMSILEREYRAQESTDC